MPTHIGFKVEKMRKWKLRIASNKSWGHMECNIVAAEVDIAIRRAAKEIANMKSVFGDQQWYLSGLDEI